MNSKKSKADRQSVQVIGVVQAGFPVPGEDLGALKLESLLVKNPPATYFLRVSGTSMQNAGIYDGDIIVVDRSLTARKHDVIVAQVDGNFTLKRLSKLTAESAELSPENDEFKQIIVDAGQEFVIWGVVTNVIHSLRK